MSKPCDLPVRVLNTSEGLLSPHCRFKVALKAGLAIRLFQTLWLRKTCQLLQTREQARMERPSKARKTLSKASSKSLASRFDTMSTFLAMPWCFPNCPAFT